MLLGAHWAYVEIGWGGYWAWDPVENASLLPWLTMTAFLHSVMIQEKNMQELKEKGYSVMETASHPDFEITRLDLKFINPKTRNKKLNKLVLARIK